MRARRTRFAAVALMILAKVLLAGGYNTSTWVAINHAWLYDPGSGR